MEDVEPAVQQHAVVLERERPLGLCARKGRDAPRELRVAVRAHEPADPLQLVVGHARIPGAHACDEIVWRQRPFQADELEQAVHGVANLGRGQARRPRHGAPFVGRPHPDDTFGVVPVGATVEERERTEREAPDAMNGRCGNFDEGL